MSPIKICVGFDQREAVVFHTFCQSVLENSSVPVSFIPLSLNLLNNYSEKHTDGSNSFIYSRFLTPHLNNYNGWAIYADGDMVCKNDIMNLWNLRDKTKAVMCAKHVYKTKAQKKYLGNINENYPRKNWSSLVLWNCEHEKNSILKPDFVQQQSGSYLHRFEWLDDSEIGDIPLTWNWLASEYNSDESVDLIHYTLGTPCFKAYSFSDYSKDWFHYHTRSQEGLGK